MTMLAVTSAAERGGTGHRLPRVVRHALEVRGYCGRGGGGEGGGEGMMPFGT